MPTTLFKNAVYSAMLPFFAPNCGKNPISGTAGHQLNTKKGFIRLIRRHHVLGSATLLSNGADQALVFTDSVNPPHHAVEQTYFRVASITKVATAAVTMRLCEKHKLSLDAPILSMLAMKPAPEELEGVTLRHLLSHTSGLMDPAALERSLDEGIPAAKVVRGMRLSEPGTAFRYSNLGYGLIGCVLEAVMNQSVDRIFDENLFIPLGMDATLSGCTLPPERIMPVTRILPYHKEKSLILTRLGRIPLLSADPERHFGHTAGSMYTTVQSLQILLKMLADGGGDFLSADSVAEMQKQHASYGQSSPTLSYGLGLLRVSDSMISPGLVLGHQGFAYGCGDGAFWEQDTGRMLIFLNGGCSEARTGRLGRSNRDFMIWAFRKELPTW